MATAIYDVSIAWDQVVKRGVPGQVATVTDATTDNPVGEVLDLDGNPIAALVSNSQGYVPPFQIVDGPALVKLRVGAITYTLLDQSRIGAATQAAEDAAQAAIDAANLVQAPADEVVKTLIEGTSSLTHTALDTTTAALLGTPGSETQAAGDGRYVQETESDATVAGLLVPGKDTRAAADVLYVGQTDPRLTGKSASITYGSYVGSAGTINYTCITLHVAGKPDPLVLNSFWDEVQRGADFRAREHDIEIARDMSGGTIIANSAGLVHISGMAHGEGQEVRTRGAVVIDGVAIQDFPPVSDTHWTGWEGFAMLKTGMLKGYSGQRGETAQMAVDEGAVWLSSFGPIIVENGAERVFTGTFFDDARAIISSLNVYGQRANGDIVMITSQGTSGISGGTLADSAAVALQEDCVFAISMDRGGSAQTFKAGVPIVASSDRDIAILTDYNKRLVANYAYSRLPVTSIAKSDKPSLYYAPTLYKPDPAAGTEGEPRVALSESGQVTLSGRMILTPSGEGGTLTDWPTTTASGLVRVPPYARPKQDVVGLFYGNGKLSGRWQVSASDGVVRISYCDAGMTYALLGQMKWQLDKLI